jgi:hypothetical protein
VHPTQARALGESEGRRDVTAQPHGVSTILFFAYTLLVMGPEWRDTGSFEAAWATGLFAATVRARTLQSGGHSSSSALFLKLFVQALAHCFSSFVQALAHCFSSFLFKL